MELTFDTASDLNFIFSKVRFYPTPETPEPLYTVALVSAGLDHKNSNAFFLRRRKRFSLTIEMRNSKGHVTHGMRTFRCHPGVRVNMGVHPDRHMLPVAGLNHQLSG